MTYNTFFFNSFKTDTQYKTLLSKNIFPKNLVRKRFKPNLSFVSLGAVCLLDTENSYSLKGLMQNIVGNYTFLRNKKFSHNKFKNLKLKSFFFSENYLTKIKTLSVFLTSLKLLRLLKKPQLTIIIYPVKGGYKVYSQGLLGFLPKSHYKFYFFKKIKTFRFTFKNFLQCSPLKTFSFKNNRLLFSVFPASKMLCILKKAVIYSFLKRQKVSGKRKPTKFFRYKKAKNCFSFKFIFVSPFIKRWNGKRNKSRDLDKFIK